MQRQRNKRLKHKHRDGERKTQKGDKQAETKKQIHKEIKYRYINKGRETNTQTFIQRKKK